jgi:hypothetical protein
VWDVLHSMAGHLGNDGALADLQFHIRPLSRRVRLHVRKLLCRTGVGDDRAGVLYYSAWIFVYGGELNAAIARVREAKA